MPTYFSYAKRELAYQIVSWVKKNKLASLLIAVLAIFILSGWVSNLVQKGRTGVATPDLIGGVTDGKDSVGSEAGDRTTIKESNLSMVVADVRKQADAVTTYAELEGGFLVSSSLESPEESPLAMVVVRIPVAKLQTAVDYYRSLAVKISSEAIVGFDVTDEYKDLTRRISTLEDTIGQLEAIKARATRISDLLAITQQIIALQEQIDALRGQKSFIDQAAKFPKITVYLSTDELALPYQPPAGFRPSVVFKLAVRSLLTNLYAAGQGLIWIAVYSVIWLPAGALVWYLLKRGKVI